VHRNTSSISWIADRDRAGVLILACVAWLVGGCDSPPQAPALRNGPVYHHKQLGFRFLVPEGWKQMGSSNLPEGALDKEICLTKFHVPSTTGAALEVLCFDRSYAPEITEYHIEPSQGIKDWQIESQPVPLDVEGAQGKRMTINGTLPNNEKQIKDVTYFIRGERVFSFVAVCSAADTKSREELQRAVRSLVWEK